MLKVLLPVDGSDSSQHAVSKVIELSNRLAPMEIHLLNVQPRILSGEVVMFAGRDAIDKYHREESENALKPARDLLEKAKVHYSVHAGVGNIAATIVLTAQELGCEMIVMGTRGMSPIKNLVVGSVANRVIHLAELPVTLVK
jgi:nucleotide-binding universal stress UspA family protein